MTNAIPKLNEIDHHGRELIMPSKAEDARIHYGLVMELIENLEAEITRLRGLGNVQHFLHTAVVLAPLVESSDYPRTNTLVDRAATEIRRLREELGKWKAESALRDEIKRLRKAGHEFYVQAMAYVALEENWRDEVAFDEAAKELHAALNAKPGDTPQ